MRRKTLWLLPALAAFAAGPASTLPSQAMANSQAPAAIRAAAEDPDELVDEILDEYGEKYEAYRSAAKAAEGDEERRAARELFPDASPFSDRLFAVATAHPKTDAAARALVWIQTRDRRKDGHGAAALELLLSDHRDRDQLAEVLARVKDAEVLEGLLKESSNINVRGVACYTLAQQAKKDDEARYIALLERCTEEFAAASYRGRPLGPMAAGALFELRHLQIGMPAPEISGEDIDGVPFKISDYRGKVVLLDFWGHW